MISKLNPLNSLFGRIFASFWLIIVAIVSTVIGIGLYFSSQDQLIEVSARQLADVQRVERLISRYVENRPHASLKDKVDSVSQRSRSHIVLVNKEEKLLITPRRPFQIPKEKLINLADQEIIYGLRYRGSVFYGPVKLTIDNKQYSAFVGKPLTLSRIRQFNRQYPWLMAVIAIFLSGAICFGLSWSLVKPVRRLQQASQLLAQGDLSARVTSGLTRQDEMGQLSRDFNAMSIKIEQLMQGQKRLLADISHELRSPLARLQLIIGIAQQSDEISIHHLDRIEKEGQQIEEMIERVLQLSRLQSNQNTLQFFPLNLSALLNKLIQDAQFEAQAQGMQICDLTQRSDAEVQGDAILLGSAIENILRNGIRYGKDKMTVDVIYQMEQAVIQIKDDGPGIEESELNNIFSPFYRLSTARSRETGGVGLGLAIANEAILAHHGTIKASNGLSSGLMVEITLPLYKE